MMSEMNMDGAGNAWINDLPPLTLEFNGISGLEGFGQLGIESNAISRPDLQLREPHQHYSSIGAGAPLHAPNNNESARPRSRGGDSDCSWTEGDNQGEWYDELRNQLRQFRKDQSSTFTTAPLNSRQRKQVHSLANLWGLSHLSIDDGSLKRVLVSKCALVHASENGVYYDRRWNPPRDNWSTGFIEPRLVLFHWISANICFRTCLIILGLPAPTHVTMDIRSDYGIVYALFETPSDAAFAMRALEGSRPEWNHCTIKKDVECDYLRLPDGFNLSQDLLGDSFYNLPVFVNQAYVEVLGTNPNEAFSRPSSPSIAQTSGTPVPFGAASLAGIEKALAGITSSTSYDLPASQRIDLSQGHHSRRPSITSSFTRDQDEFLQASAQLIGQFPPLSSSNIPSGAGSRRHSRTSSCSKDPGYISASSQVDSDYSYATNASKKRKREPMIPCGYKCSVDGCEKTFDHDGERRKHEKNHGDERPHVCFRCAKGFLYPKDLRRHLKTHATESKPVSPMMEPISDVSDLELDDVRLDDTVLGASSAFNGNLPLVSAAAPATPLTDNNATAAHRSKHTFGKLTHKVAGLFGTGKKPT